jgi:hypothetical protein
VLIPVAAVALDRGSSTRKENSVCEMKRTALIGFRVEPAIKEAAEQAAVDDRRSLSSLMEKILVEFLQRRGYLGPKSQARQNPR